MKTILLVEDDRFISRAYTDGLTRAGYRVVAVFDGAEALKKLTTLKPDIILLDLIMPVMDGFEVLKRIKGDDRLKDIPLLIISNLGHENHVRQAIELGADDYLVKSNHSLADLVQKIQSHLPAGRADLPKREAK